MLYHVGLIMVTVRNPWATCCHAYYSEFGGSLFHFSCGTQLFTPFELQIVDSADHKMANFMALARSDDVHFSIESRFGVDLVVCHLAGKAK